MNDYSSDSNCGMYEIANYCNSCFMSMYRGCNIVFAKIISKGIYFCKSNYLNY